MREENTVYISKVDIYNYRLLNKTRISCEKDLSLIIGKNNCGKTSFLSILSKCVGSKNEIGSFDFNDFSTSFQKRLYSVVKGEASFKPEELEGIRVDFYIDYDENDDLTNISTLMLDLDPKNTTVILRFEYVLKNNISKLREDFTNYEAERSSLTSEVAFDKFIKKNHKKYFEFLKYSVLYDYKTERINDSIFKLLDNKDIDISKIIAFNYVSARRNVSNATDLELSALASVYYEKTKNKEENDTTTLKFEKQVDETDKEFDEIYTETFKNLMDKLSKFGGIRKNENVVKVISQIQVSKLLKDNTTVVYDDQSNFLPENYNGLGYLNLFSIIMKIETLMSDFRKDNKPDEQPADINLLFIEEPEAHTHPQMQYVFVKNIKNLLEMGRRIGNGEKAISLQTFMTTHSSHIVAESDFDDIKYFVKEPIGVGFNIISKNLRDLRILYQKEKGLDNNHFKFLKQYLTLNRSEIFFADKIILIEGDTERILLPAMMKKTDQDHNYELPLMSQNISIIEVGNYSEVYSEFVKFIGTKTLIITDIDTYYLSDDVDNNGNIKKNKDGSIKRRETLCRVCEGEFTSNSSLKFYLKDQLESNKGTPKYVLVGLTLKEKIVSPCDIIDQEDDKKEGVWKANRDGKVLIVYQTTEVNSEGVEYNARSFEDAFFHINRKLFTELDETEDEKKIKKCAEMFQGLKRVELFFDKTKDSFDLASACVSKKPSLAMDILLNSKSENGNDFINWQVPQYIKEGLEWLQKD